MPAVVATGNATQIIRDGALVTVNGTTGTITLHD
ncbi:MAG: PEP-utilizing enzyme [Cellulosimicrobium cellulans]